jgi:hypothetical protein
MGPENSTIHVRVPAVPGLIESVAVVEEADATAAALAALVVVAAAVLAALLVAATVLAAVLVLVTADALAVVDACVAALVALVTAVGTGAALVVAAELVTVAVPAPPHAARTPTAGNANAVPSACRRSVRREVKEEPDMSTPFLNPTDTSGVVSGRNPRSPLPVPV